MNGFVHSDRKNPHSLPVKELFVRSGDESKNRQKGRENTHACLEQRWNACEERIPDFQTSKESSFELWNYCLRVDDLSTVTCLYCKWTDWHRTRNVFSCPSAISHLCMFPVYTAQWKELSSIAKREIRFFSSSLFLRPSLSLSLWLQGPLFGLSGECVLLSMLHCASLRPLLTICLLPPQTGGNAR